MEALQIAITFHITELKVEIIFMKLFINTIFTCTTKLAVIVIIFNRPGKIMENDKWAI